MKSDKRFEALKRKMRKDPKAKTIHLEKDGLEIALTTNSECIIAQKEDIVNYIVQFRRCGIKSLKKAIYKSFSKRIKRKLKVIVKTTHDRKRWAILMRYSPISYSGKRRSPR